MFEIGSTVMVFLNSGYNPAVFCGRVARPIGPFGAELESAVMIKRSPGHKWAKLAAGDKAARREAQYDDHADTIQFDACAYYRHWIGKLPDISSRIER